MAKEIIIPRLSLTMTDGSLLAWLKNEGDSVTKGDLIADIETDKVVLQIEAPTDGVLAGLITPPVHHAPVGTIIGWILEAGESLGDRASLVGTQQSDQLLPHLVKRDAATATAGSEAPKLEHTSEDTKSIKASPAAKKLAKELGVDLSKVSGSGPNNRITSEDVEKYSRSLAVTEEAVATVKATPLARRIAENAGVDITVVPGSGPGGKVTRADVEQAIVPAPPVAMGNEPAVLETVQLTGVRRVVSERMAKSFHTVAPVTYNLECDMTEMVNWRNQFNIERAKADKKPISYNDLLILIVSRVLREQPLVNARIDNDTIQRMADVNIGLAVDTERGLMVPVVKQADQLSLDAIADETRRLIELTRSGRIGLDYLNCGTFTISNLGMFDIEHFSPIINLPEAAILGVGRIIEKPVGYQGQIVLRPMMGLSLTADHRLIDGAPAARFLQSIKRYIEKPLLLVR